jgi:hypothetical protein
MGRVNPRVLCQLTVRSLYLPLQASLDLHRAKIVEEVSDNFDIDENGEPFNDGWRQYCVSLGDGSHEDILTYNQILAHLEKQSKDDIKRELHGEKVWTFKEILDHCRVEGQLMVLVIWEDNSCTWEPLNNIGKGDPVTIADFAKRNDLIDTP